MCARSLESMATIKRTASIEWLDNPAGVLRVHNEGGRYGDAYDWCCTVENHGDLAILHGVISSPSPSQFRAIFDALRQAGFVRVEWIRMGKKVSRWKL